ncbi:MAG: WecB/TagA/CpsF family glycosyltransferase [Alkalilacustris sp.]
MSAAVDGDGGPADLAALLALINQPDAEALLADLDGRLARGEGFSVATMNLDHLVKLRRQPAFRAAYRAHSHVVADGRPVVWARRLAGRPVALVPGSELVAPLMALAARTGTPVGFLGATEAALEAAAARLEAAHPGLRVVARVAPPMGLDPAGAAADAALEALAAAGARLVLMALGAPKQEILVARATARLDQVGFVSVGAGIDFVAGTQRRAPVWMRRLAVEWLWRLLGNPARLAGRYAACIAILPPLAWAALRLRRD